MPPILSNEDLEQCVRDRRDQNLPCSITAVAKATGSSRDRAHRAIRAVNAVTAEHAERAAADTTGNRDAALMPQSITRVLDSLDARIIVEAMACARAEERAASNVLL
jgi:hypothetical protein